mmetsp:Transcript_95011/g.150192  ORF Transcript_95011/g.150192 Transcript_95011/m.150192 type:complete len:202 (+) Transcript_95011:256-861(+)
MSFLAGIENFREQSFRCAGFGCFSELQFLNTGYYQGAVFVVSESHRKHRLCRCVSKFQESWNCGIIQHCRRSIHFQKPRLPFVIKRKVETEKLEGRRTWLSRPTMDSRPERQICRRQDGCTYCVKYQGPSAAVPRLLGEVAASFKHIFKRYSVLSVPPIRFVRIWVRSTARRELILCCGDAKISFGVYEDDQGVQVQYEAP